MGFRAAVAVVLVALTVVIVGASMVTLGRGPRVRELIAEPAALVQRPGVVVTLETDQPLDERSLEGALIEPAVDAEFVLSGAAIQIRFDTMLDYGQDYRVTLPALRGASTGRTAEFGTTISTPPLELSTLLRSGAFGSGEGEPDLVVRHNLTAGASSTALEAGVIQEYVDVDDGVVAVTLDDVGNATVVVGRGSARPTEPEALPLTGSGSITQLRASPRTNHFGFIFTGTADDIAYTSTLFVADTAGLARGATPILGLDGLPLQASEWRFVPGTAFAVVHAFDGGVYMIDAAGAAEPRLLGQHGGLAGFLPGTTTLALTDAGGLSTLDLTTGVSTLVRPAAEGAVVEAPDALLDQDTELVVSAEGRYPTAILTSGDEERVVFRAPRADSSIREICVSSNARLAVIEVIGPGSVSDGYPALSAFEGVTSSIVDLQTARVIGTVDGFLPSWC